MQKGALSRAARANDGNHLAALDGEIDRVEHRDELPVAADVGLGQRLRLDHAHSRIASTGVNRDAWIAG